MSDQVIFRMFHHPQKTMIGTTLGHRNQDGDLTFKTFLPESGDFTVIPSYRELHQLLGSHSKVCASNAQLRCTSRLRTGGYNRIFKLTEHLHPLDCTTNAIKLKRNHLTVIPYFLEHNYKSSKFLYDRLLVNQRLIENELGTCMALLKYVAPSCEVRQFVADEFGEILTTRDTYIYRRKKRNHLTVIPYFLEHNYKSSKFLYDRLLVNQRLIENELGTCMALLKYVAPSCEVRQFVADEFGEILTTRDTYIYRRKCRPALLSGCRIVGFYCGRRYAIGAGETSGYRTHACVAVRERYKLYTFLITDGMGIERPIMYAFVKSEHFAPMHKLFDLFKEIMCKNYSVKTFVMDQLVAQMRAARVMSGCDVTLCYFHIGKAIRKHYVSFNNHVFLVTGTLCKSRHIYHRMACLKNAA
ncbi:hypothetical protein CLF_100751 [Clonorchis sinensis]|uniref:ZSWIM1/3 RNaseH-like domain-containing protein n=1 Tax=Clonorchis sinensis TaxID=79923 RepID=G7Y460_CLOSI|nr:hypothetical protein CLF_100751 [Clonorchis sinensis]